MKTECEIIHDLLPNYIENLLSEKTKIYVDNHIKNCNECKNYLEMIREEKEKEDNIDKQEQKIELDYLKKYRRKMLVFKIASFILLLFLLIISTIFVIRFCKVNSIINNANNKIQELSLIDNYSVHTSLYHIDYKTKKQYITYNEYYYKDGKYKETSNIYGINFKIQGDTSSLHYGNAYNDDQSERYINNLFNSYSLYLQDLGFFNNIKVRAGLVLNETVREEKFSETDCYIFRTETPEYYKETWIDKYSLVPIKEIQEVYGKTYDEKIISFLIGEVKSEDILSKQGE